MGERILRMLMWKATVLLLEVLGGSSTGKDDFIPEGTQPPRLTQKARRTPWLKPFHSLPAIYPTQPTARLLPNRHNNHINTPPLLDQNSPITPSLPQTSRPPTPQFPPSHSLPSPPSPTHTPSPTSHAHTSLVSSPPTPPVARRPSMLLPAPGASLPCRRRHHRQLRRGQRRRTYSRDGGCLRGGRPWSSGGVVRAGFTGARAVVSRGGPNAHMLAVRLRLGVDGAGPRGRGRGRARERDWGGGPRRELRGAEIPGGECAGR